MLDDGSPEVDSAKIIFLGVFALVMIVMLAIGYDWGSRHYFATCPEIHDQLLQAELSADKCKQKLEKCSGGN